MASSRPATPDPTEIAGRYIIDRKLGAGAFGTVYKAKDRILGRMVAIKTIRLEGLAAQGAGLEEMLQRFEREARVSATLKHPNIVTIYDLGNADGLSYLAMEFIDGVGLERLIAQGRLPLERAAGLAAQVADGLDFAHKNGVVHRDIKPANIMVEAGDRVKVPDFGIAKVTESADHLTMTGSLLGTPSYMSPEQARGGAIDGRSDLFSVGCVLYEMLAGKKAFRGESITALIFKIITEEPLPIRELAGDVPDAMVHIIQKALSKTPEARYQSGHEMAADLLAFTRPGTTPTLRQSETPTVPPTILSAPLPTLQVAPTIASPPTQAGVATRVAPAPKPTAPPPLPPPPPAAARPAAPPRPLVAPVARKSGGGAGMLIGIGVLGLGFLAAVVIGGWFFFLRKPAASIIAENTVPTQPPPSLAATVPAPPVTEPPPSLATAPPATVPGVAPPPATPLAVGPVTRPAAKTPPAGPGATTRPPAEAPPASGDAGQGASSFLDEEPPQVDGAEAGARAAEAYRSPNGGGGRPQFGTNRPLDARPMSPRPRMPGERPALGTLRHIINAQEAFKKKHHRYGTFAEMAAAQTLFLDTNPQANTFTRRGYKFELQSTSDSFRVVALPQSGGLRPFVADESGYIQLEE